MRSLEHYVEERVMGLLKRLVYYPYYFLYPWCIVSVEERGKLPWWKVPGWMLFHLGVPRKGITAKELGMYVHLHIAPERHKCVCGRYYWTLRKSTKFCGSFDCFMKMREERR